jgi:hypothetical protein
LFDCQRKFTIDNKNIVTGFVSTCWDWLIKLFNFS